MDSRLLIVLLIFVLATSQKCLFGFHRRKMLHYYIFRKGFLKGDNIILFGQVRKKYQ